MRHDRGRSGAILLIVAGLAGLLVTLAVAFLGLVQRGESTAAQLQHEAQARVMLQGACAYILESGRLGYDDDAFYTTYSQHREGYGWVDVRGVGGILPANSVAGLSTPAVTLNGLGPRDQNGDLVFNASSTAWPNIGGVKICPMYRWTRPPFAISLKTTYNPIVADLDKRSNASGSVYGQPFLTKPDPESVADTWSAFKSGDPAPAPGSTGLAWFRVCRHSLTRFVVTCGAGGTHGYKNWDEAVLLAPTTEGDTAVNIFGSKALFEGLLRDEVRLWYEVQWSAAVPPITPGVDAPGFSSQPPNASAHSNNQTFTPPAASHPCGTITYIQRLQRPPQGTHPDTKMPWNW